MERRAITVRGIVQGVGFRPYANRLATRLHLNGFVKNHAGSVIIEVEGPPPTLNQFLDELQTHLPPLSQIDSLSWEPRPVRGDRQFCIASSESEASSQVFVSADIATCSECLAELFNPSDRRYRYPFLNCTNCGPRLTIIQGVPYDRERTTMAPFAMCATCRAEYEDPGNRRFHAQPTACADCGPQLVLRTSSGEPIETADPLARFGDAVRHGQIGALKGLGGYHLVCDALLPRAVGELRRRKHRDERPFAVLVRDISAAQRLCYVSTWERELLESRRRPIVLLRKRPAREGSHVGLVDAVAPGNPYLGVMLPYTPLHHLLVEMVDGHPLVMTSGNRSDEPIAHLDDEVIQRLGDIADLFLMHNRSIQVRCDDSVTRIVHGSETLVRRSRGYAPEPIKLPFELAMPILAVGGQFKGTFALGCGPLAFLSHHLGDLDHFDAYRAFERDIRLYEELFDIRPALLVHDLHPDYASTAYAERREADELLPRLAVQHHHAHMASCMAENGLDGPAIGVCFDGTGFGTDGTIWGGEFLVGDYAHFHRAAHFRRVRLPGGDRATRETWRSAVSYLLDAGCDCRSALGLVSTDRVKLVRQMLERGLNSPVTSSVGRLFDAVAAIVGVRDSVSYEGQAAQELEWLATEVPADGAYPFDVGSTSNSQPGDCRAVDPPRGHFVVDRDMDVIDTRPMVRAIVEEVARGVAKRTIARRFHSTLVDMIAEVAGRIRGQTGLSDVVLSGGVFQNALLSIETYDRLVAANFRVFRHRRVPSNDGGLCLGQLAIAAARGKLLARGTDVSPVMSQPTCPT